MEQLSTGVDAYDFFSDDHDTLTATLFANAQQLAFDGEGRIVLPSALIEQTVFHSPVHDAAERRETSSSGCAPRRISSTIRYDPTVLITASPPSGRRAR